MPLYSADKQDEIIYYLDSLTETIDSKKNELNKLDELIKSRFMCQEVHYGIC